MFLVRVCLAFPRTDCQKQSKFDWEVFTERYPWRKSLVLRIERADSSFGLKIRAQCASVRRWRVQVGSITASFTAADEKAGDGHCGSTKWQNNNKQTLRLFRIGEIWLSDLPRVGKYQMLVRNTKRFGSASWLTSSSSVRALSRRGLKRTMLARRIDPKRASYSGAASPSRARWRSPGAVILD